MKQAIRTKPEAPRITPMPALRLAGLMRRYPATPEAMQELAKQWLDFAHGAGSKLLAAGPVMYGVHIGLFGDSGNDDYFSGVEIKTGEVIPAGLSELRLPPMTCAVMDHKGPVGEISQTTSDFLREDIPHTGHQLPRSRPFDLIERYGKNFDPQAARGDIQLIIPVEK
jgi:predicted transcriptional regulator YdeE